MLQQTQLEALKRKIGGKESGQSIDNPDMMIEIHHLFMKEYGWIPLEEFRALPIPTIWGLLDCIKKQHEHEERALSKARGKR